MNPAVRYEWLTNEQEQEAVALVRRVFDANVAPNFTETGRTTFHEYITLFAFSRRPGDYFAMAAFVEDTMVGVVEITDGHHVALFFVAPEQQQRGIGRELLRQAAGRCLRHDPRPSVLTVNASPNALNGYKRLGFTPTGDEREEQGIRFIPMELPLTGMGAA
ncbi:GNAT family N-acetyltransferase [Pseudodesulfovibrio sp.]|uniref:GNAT family N-acetyltransferase n=1 Tax=unclassified Pseudodesulfovibrio TaxID=2661612 RepID=UPI003B004D2E